VLALYVPVPRTIAHWLTEKDLRMDRAHDIFERIRSKGIGAVTDFIADRKSEELFLDFKRSSCDGKDSKLSENDRNNLGKAISGFGNSEGGVIVWGVDCSKDHDGADVAKALVALENPKRFASLIQGAISGCTIPPHTKVQTEAIETADNKGIVITLIPKSDVTPHQAIPSKRYYIRAGSDFVPTPHDVLAGMFGRRPQPHVFPNFILGIPALAGASLHISFGIAIHNEGPGIASDIFAICRTESEPGPSFEISIEQTDAVNWAGNVEFQSQVSIISAQGYRLPPGATNQPLVLHLVLRPPFENELRLFVSVGSGQSPRYDLLIKQDAKIIEAQYNKFVAISQIGGLSRSEKQEIARVIVGDLK
jgi:hypothetical protein